MDATSGNFTERKEPDEAFSHDDATWVLTSSIVIFTMQTGFGLLESGCVAPKNEVNILMKNAADIVLGGVTYWLFGYGLQYSKENSTIAFGGADYFVVDADISVMGLRFCEFIFQLSFSTTATTIVSGAMAERTNYNAYCVFSLLNTIVYCIPAGWVWGNHGFLKSLGALDFAGSGCVHLLGGVSALVAAVFLGPRKGRFSKSDDAQDYSMSNPTNVIFGTLTLWWGWLVFNCGSSFGVTHRRWMYASRAAVSTINASVGGGMIGIIYSYMTKGKFHVDDIVNSILVALVSVTAGSGYLTAYEGLVVGTLGAIISCGVPQVLEKYEVDDPVGAFTVHAVGGLWGMLAVGFFLENDSSLIGHTNGNSGLFHGGGIYLLGVQLLASLCIIIWSGVITFVLLKLVNYIVPIRMSASEEFLGADFAEHGIVHPAYDYALAIEELRGSHLDIPVLALDANILNRPSVNRRTFDHFMIQKCIVNDGFGNLVEIQQT